VVADASRQRAPFVCFNNVIPPQVFARLPPGGLHVAVTRAEQIDVTVDRTDPLVQYTTNLNCTRHTSPRET
jgi:hypothetical protein